MLGLSASGFTTFANRHERPQGASLWVAAPARQRRCVACLSGRRCLRQSQTRMGLTDKKRVELAWRKLI
jgi:hypothetical protein